MNTFKNFKISQCPRRCVLQLILSREIECEGLLPGCRVGVKESESKDDSSWMRWQHTATYFLKYGQSDNCVTRQATSDRQLDVRWLQVHAWHDCVYVCVWVVYNHWTGLVDWTGGLDWWTDVFFCAKITFVLSYETSLSWRFRRDGLDSNRNVHWKARHCMLQACENCEAHLFVLRWELFCYWIPLVLTAL